MAPIFEGCCRKVFRNVSFSPKGLPKVYGISSCSITHQIRSAELQLILLAPENPFALSGISLGYSHANSLSKSIILWCEYDTDDRCCLLADHFFLVSSHLARQEHRLPVELPFAEKFSPLDPEKQSLTISVDLDRQIYVSGDDVDISQLRQILADYQASRGASAAIRIRTDSAAVQYQYVEPILREAAKLGIADAAIAVQEETRYEVTASSGASIDRAENDAYD